MFLLLSIMSLAICVLAICFFNALGYIQKLQDANYELRISLNQALRTIDNIKYQDRTGAKVPTLHEVV